jgi:glycosyltransferase involved in cell wall biosynthesis
LKKLTPRVLIITYYWPPGSGAGVQRWLKFAKYLPSFGWEPVILTVDPEYAAFPAIDNSLLDEISTDLEIYRTKARDWFRIYRKDKTKIPSAGFASNDNKSFAGKITKFIRGNFFIPDPRRGWNRYAFREACRLIETEGIKHVITTSPPHSTQLIGLALRKKYPGIKWIADLRDPWTDIYYYNQFYHTTVSRKIDKYYEKRVLKSADRIITVGKSLKDIFCTKIPELLEKIEIIPNGYDETDFSEIRSTDPEEFTISYIGTLSDSYPVSGLMEAISDLANSGYSIKLRFAGAVSPNQKNIISSTSGKIESEFLSYVNHYDAIKLMMGSSLLLLIIPDHFSNKSIVTGKLFEYLAAGKPVLCLGPTDGDAAEILEASSHGQGAAYSDSEKICHIIADYYKTKPNSIKEAPKEYSRSELTKRLAAQLRSDNEAKLI